MHPFSDSATFIYLFKHERHRPPATYMPVKSSTMNIYTLDSEIKENNCTIGR